MDQTDLQVATYSMFGCQLSEAGLKKASAASVQMAGETVVMIILRCFFSNLMGETHIDG